MIPQSAPPPRLILASASPRRRDLLREAGYEFEIYPADVDEESIGRGLAPTVAAARIALAKALKVSDRSPTDIVLAADTVVILNGQMLGKPADESDARRMLHALAGSEHHVFTAVVITRSQPNLRVEQSVSSSVRMRALSDTEIDAYVAGGNWRGKAGGYGIQDADPFITRTAGCATNIVGLPMTTTRQMLAEIGVHPK